MAISDNCRVEWGLSMAIMPENNRCYNTDPITWGSVEVGLHWRLQYVLGANIQAS
jgi:hypothetical protein